MLKKVFRSVLILMSLSLTTSTFAESSLNFNFIPMHYGLLKGEPHTFSESEGLKNFTLSSNAQKGDEELVLTGNLNLHPSELVTYRSTSGLYYVAQVKEITGNTVVLMNPLKEGINLGDNIWNFYNDPSHPNSNGYKAIADYALEHLKTEDLANKIHGFAGDSWFNNNHLVPHFTSKLNATQIINKGVGGRKSSDVLEAFDADFPNTAAVQPDFIWVILGTNDYWGKVTREKYIDNLKKIIIKINNLGAKALVFTSSVGPVVFDANLGGLSSFHQDLSDDYADDLLALHSSGNGNDEIKAYSQDSNLVIELTTPQPPNNNYHYSYFIDTDNNKNTGHSYSSTKWGETGLDYMIQDNSLYKSLGNDSSWAWEYKGPVVSADINKIVVSKSDIGLASNAQDITIKVGVLVKSSNWSTLDYYPKSGKLQEFTIKALEAIKDTATTPSGIAITIDVLLNDIGNGLHIGWFDDPTNGSTQVLANNLLMYTPDAGFTGIDDFWYQAIDSSGQSTWGNVVVAVGDDTVLKANHDTVTVKSGQTIFINVLANDTGSQLELDAFDAVWSGSMSIIGNTLEYQSDGTHIGELVTWYGITDSNDDVDWAKVTINITQ